MASWEIVLDTFFCVWGGVGNPCIRISGVDYEFVEVFTLMIL